MKENKAMNPQTAVITRLCSFDIIPLEYFMSFEFASSADIDKFEVEFILPKPHRIATMYQIKLFMIM